MHSGRGVGGEYQISAIAVEIERGNVVLRQNKHIESFVSSIFDFLLNYGTSKVGL